MQINKILLTGMLCAFYFFSSAQNKGTTITGKVLDSDNLALEGVSVRIKTLKIGTSTGTAGTFTLTGLKPGNYILQFTAIGYLSEEITVKAGIEATVAVSTVQLHKDSRQMETVNIAGKTERRKLAESGFNVNAIETKAYANTTADLNQVLSRSTGIRVRESGGLGSDFNFSINGLSGKQVKFFIDGIPMENFGSSMSLNNIPVNLAERVEVYKGVVPIDLGADALGGAVNIVTNQQVKKYIDASYSFGSFNTHRANLSGRYTAAKSGFTINASGFYNYADNDYLMKDVVVQQAAGNVTKDVKRFNDGYQSVMGQTDFGFRDKKWADILLVGILYSSNYKERQTGAEQDLVYGKVHARGNFVMPSLKYKKTDLFVKGLDASFFASYAQDKTTTIDTSASNYNWEGQVISRDNNFAEQGAFAIYKYTNKFAIIRSNLAYVIDTHNSLSLNYALSAGRRSGINTYPSASQDGNALDVPNKLDKGIIGLSWQNQLLNDRLSTSVFGKQYRLHSYIRTAVFYNGSGYAKEEAANTSNFYGYGIASRYKLTDDAGIKVSYEHAFRLPEVEELFGDGFTVLANPQLKPEESDNVNIGLYIGKTVGNHRFAAEVSGFYRNAKDFINAVPGGIYSSYTNIGQVRITGIDGELKYNHTDLLSFTVNASYMNAVNTDKSSTVYDDRIPNQPWLFGNADFSIGKNDLLGKDSRIQFNWFSQYTHWFYLNWPSRGYAESKSLIPTQLVHNAALSYSMLNGKYNVSLESRNLFDARAYDSFRLQKPGRSYFIKLRYFIR